MGQARITDPDSDALVTHVKFEALQSQTEDYSLYVLAAPQVKNRGYGNIARLVENGDRTVLLDWRQDI